VSFFTKKNTKFEGAKGVRGYQTFAWKKDRQGCCCFFPQIEKTYHNDGDLIAIHGVLDCLING